MTICSFCIKHYKVDSYENKRTGHILDWKLKLKKVNSTVVDALMNKDFFITGLDINVCPIPVKTDVSHVRQVDLVSWLSDGTSEKITVLSFGGYFL